MVTDPQLYGLIAQFETPEALLEAARQAHQAGYREMDAYSPYQVEGLAEALGVSAKIRFERRYVLMADDDPDGIRTRESGG